MIVRPVMRWLTALSYLFMAISPVLALIAPDPLSRAVEFYVWAWVGGLVFGGALGIYGVLRPSIGWELVGLVLLLTCYTVVLAAVTYVLVAGMVRGINAEMFTLATMAAFELLLTRRFAELLTLLRSSPEGTDA